VQRKKGRSGKRYQGRPATLRGGNGNPNCLWENGEDFKGRKNKLSKGLEKNAI